MSDSVKKSCGTCMFWKLPPNVIESPWGICGAITADGRSVNDAEIVGGGQGVSEPIYLQTNRDHFWCSEWSHDPWEGSS